MKCALLAVCNNHAQNNDDLFFISLFQVMAVGIELPKQVECSLYTQTYKTQYTCMRVAYSLVLFIRHYMKKEWLTMVMLLFPVMIFMWLISGLIIWTMITPITFVSEYVYIQSRKLLTALLFFLARISCNIGLHMSY